MKNHKKLLSWLAGGISVLFLIAAVIGLSDAQAQSGKSKTAGDSQQGGGFGGGFGGGAGGQGGGGGYGGGQGFPGFGGGSSIAANTEYVYVLQNNTLHQFSASDLKAIKSVPLPAVTVKHGKQ